MKTIKTFMFVITIFGTYGSCCAQIPTNIKEALQNKTWKFEGTEDGISFKFDNCNYSFYWNNEQISTSVGYYLSNTSCENKPFDSNLVCQPSNGNFISIQNERGCFQIEFLSKNKFRMKSIGANRPQSGKNWITYIGF